MFDRTPELKFEEGLDSLSRVLVVNPLNSYWSYQLTSEIALRCTDFTSNVRWLNLGPKTPRRFEIDPNDHYSSLLHRNINKKLSNFLRQSGISVSGKVQSLDKISPNLTIRNLSDYRDFQFNGIPLGKMVFSALASNLKTTSINPESMRDPLNFFTLHAQLCYSELTKELRTFKPNLILTINDRLIGSSMAISLAKQNGIKHGLAYWGHSTDYIEDYSDSLYDGYEWESKISDAWDKLDLTDTNEILSQARADIEKLAVSPSLDSEKYLTSQIRGTSIDAPREFCVFYAQSEHEHSGHLIIDPKERFSNQYAAFDALQRVCKKIGLDVYLKFHPLPAGLDNKTWESSRLDWNSVSFNDKVHIIEENSTIDTYTLITEAKFNVVWSSTVGLECIARGISPIVLGFPLWLNRKWDLHAWTEDSLEKKLQIAAGALEPQILLPYFHYRKTFGRRCRFSNKERVWNSDGFTVYLWTFTLIGAAKYRLLPKFKQLVKYFF